jgi:hypothetical protein
MVGLDEDAAVRPGPQGQIQICGHIEQGGIYMPVRAGGLGKQPDEQGLETPPSCLRFLHVGPGHVQLRQHLRGWLQPWIFPETGLQRRNRGWQEFRTGAAGSANGHVTSDLQNDGYGCR